MSLLMSCATSTFYFLELPPELVLPSAIDKVAVVSAFDTTRLDFRENKNTVFSNGSNELIKSLVKELRQQTELNVVLLDTLISEDTLYFYPPKSIDVAGRGAFGKRAGAPLLLVLESFQVYFDKEMEVVKEEDGSKSRTAHYDLVAAASINLYDSAGYLVDEAAFEMIHPDYDSRSVLSGLLAAGPSMKKARKHAMVLSRDIGLAWVDGLFPSEVVVERYIFTNKVPKESIEALLAQDWQTAISLLTPLTSHSDRKISGKACYNLSVAYEAIGELNLAEEWRYEAGEKLGPNQRFEAVEY